MIREPPDHSAASQPSLVLKMLEELKADIGQKVLEIGTGSGWNAGLLAFGVGDDRLVHSIDIQSDLIEAARAHLYSAGFPDIQLVAGDGGQGWEEKAPFDRIIVTVRAPDIPPPWCQQLAEGGILLLPFKMRGIGDPLLRLEKHDGRIKGGFVGWSGFMTLQGDFWTDEEDPLWPPWDPLIDRLLSGRSETLSISEPMSVDCLFLLYLEGVRFRALFDYERNIGAKPTVFDRESESICSFDFKEPVVTVYGDRSAAEWLVFGLQEWSRMDRPRIADFRVTLLGSEIDRPEAGGWLIKRPHATLELLL
jgi:protein-L-isoaspartate(D-aspartate) O-methyltransferase